MAYQSIENYGIIGNMRTVALVGMNGSIDWYCYPKALGGGWWWSERWLICSLRAGGSACISACVDRSTLFLSRVANSFATEAV
jgi:hypothetical protein